MLFGMNLARSSALTQPELYLSGILKPKTKNAKTDVNVQETFDGSLLNALTHPRHVLSHLF